MVSRTKIVLGLAAAGLSVSLLGPAAAEAASPPAPLAGSFTFCNASSAQEYVAFPYRGNLASVIRNPGQCWSLGFHGISSDEAVAYRHVNGTWLAVGTRYFNDAHVVKWSI